MYYFNSPAQEILYSLHMRKIPLIACKHSTLVVLEYEHSSILYIVVTVRQNINEPRHVISKNVAF